VVIAGYFAYFVYGAMFQPNTSFNEAKVAINIPTNASYDAVKAIISPYLADIDKFDALAVRKKYVQNIKPGRFIIKKGMSNNDIINAIRIGNTPIKIAFNNQESLEKLAGRISSQIEADSVSLLAAFRDNAFLETHKFSEATALSMYIPNSYEFFWNTSAEGFRDKMLREYNRFWNADRVAKAQKIGLSPEEVITLASIVHEESKQAAEQPRIAGVYLNRIRIGMPLQADPTLRFAAYKLPKYRNTVIKRVLNVHKEIKSPYNTYKNRGLPPGLIAMPDISAIDAVLNFERHKYLYFAADANRFGFHKFAKTLSQHNVNAREYQRYLTKQGIRR
jgi:UPF0755 protein